MTMALLMVVLKPLDRLRQDLLILCGVLLQSCQLLPGVGMRTHAHLTNLCLDLFLELFVIGSQIIHREEVVRHPCLISTKEIDVHVHLVGACREAGRGLFDLVVKVTKARFVSHEQRYCKQNAEQHKK